MLFSCQSAPLPDWVTIYMTRRTCPFLPGRRFNKRGIELINSTKEYTNISYEPITINNIETAKTVFFANFYSINQKESLYFAYEEGMDQSSTHNYF